MHELSLAKSVMDLTVGEALKYNASGISVIRLCIGEYSDVVPSYIIDCFKLLSKGTIAEDAKLEFNKIPAKIKCRECLLTSHPSPGEYACSVCGSNNVELISGTEFYVENIEIED